MHKLTVHVKLKVRLLDGLKRPFKRRILSGKHHPSKEPQCEKTGVLFYAPFLSCERDVCILSHFEQYKNKNTFSLQRSLSRVTKTTSARTPLLRRFQSGIKARSVDYSDVHHPRPQLETQLGVLAINIHPVSSAGLCCVYSTPRDSCCGCACQRWSSKMSCGCSSCRRSTCGSGSGCGSGYDTGCGSGCDCGCG